MKSISKLIYIPKQFKTDFLGVKTAILPQLIIWAGTRKYQLCGPGGSISSEAEVQWLAHELSYWLGIHITQE